MDVVSFGPDTAVNVNVVPVQIFTVIPSSWTASSLRRVMEYIVASVLLLLFAPILLIVALAVRLSSKGPILFRQKRMGQQGQIFTIYKFRSMINSDTQWSGPSITVQGDARVTFVGSFLRRYKLDELPQLWNVLKGDMSLVGPRPKLPQHEGLYLSCRPGITGAATLAFRDEEALLARIPPEKLHEVYENLVKPAKNRLDTDYMRNATFSSDCRIIWKTVVSCLRPSINPVALTGEFLERSLSNRNSLRAHPTSASGLLENGRKRNPFVWQLSALFLIMLTSMLAAAQHTETLDTRQVAPSRVDLFAGYSYWATDGSVANVPFKGSNKGIAASAALYFNRYLGAQLEGKYYFNESDNSLKSVSIGPVLRFPTAHGFTPFLHLLGGAADIEGPNVPNVATEPGGPVHQEFASWGPQLTVGEGLDYRLPWFHHRVDWRIFQADYLFDHVSFNSRETAGLNSASLSTGLVFHIGSLTAPAAQTNFACVANPETVFPGEPVTLTGIDKYARLEKKASYEWISQGKIISGPDSMVTFDTAHLHAGKYMVIGRVTQGSKHHQLATCMAQFTVQSVPGYAIGAAARGNE